MTNARQVIWIAAIATILFALITIVACTSSGKVSWEADVQQPFPESPENPASVAQIEESKP